MFRMMLRRTALTKPAGLSPRRRLMNSTPSLTAAAWGIRSRKRIWYRATRRVLLMLISDFAKFPCEKPFNTQSRRFCQRRTPCTISVRSPLSASFRSGDFNSASRTLSRYESVLSTRLRTFTAVPRAPPYRDGRGVAGASSGGTLLSLMRCHGKHVAEEFFVGLGRLD